MNKYQEAIAELKIKWVHNIQGYVNQITVSTPKKPIETLQELVDRATPMKPIINPTMPFQRLCPTCNGIVFKERACSDNACRQAIDWNE